MKNGCFHGCTFYLYINIFDITNYTLLLPITNNNY